MVDENTRVKVQLRLTYYSLSGIYLLVRPNNTCTVDYV